MISQDPGRIAAYESNKQSAIQRTLFEAAKPLKEQTNEVIKSLQEIKELLVEVVGMLKYMDIGAYNQHRIQKMYEEQDGKQG